MSTKDEIMLLEDQLRTAELGPNPQFFEEILDDNALLDGQRMKSKIVDAHRPGKGQAFTSVEMSGFEIVDHGDVVIVLCKGKYVGPQWSGSLKFMRIWLKKDSHWKIIAGTSGPA